MRDQLDHLPPQVPAAMLWRGQTKAQAMQVLGDLAVSIPADMHLHCNLNASTPVLDHTTGDEQQACSGVQQSLMDHRNGIPLPAVQIIVRASSLQSPLSAQERSTSALY